MRINSFFSKLLLIFSILLLTYLYAQYERKKYYSNNDNSVSESFLKVLPNFATVEVATNTALNSREFLKSSSGVFVHIWGTWCAPCEKEMPDFLKYAEDVKEKGVKFLLIAVDDEDVKVRKFMARFVIPKNVTIVLDKKNIVMDLFGSLKVPETYLFDGSGKHINKFIGPQDWMQESYKTRLDSWLNIRNLVDRKIETH